MRNRIDTILQLEKGHEKSKITVGYDEIMSLLAHLLSPRKKEKNFVSTPLAFTFANSSGEG